MPKLRQAVTMLLMFVLGGVAVGGVFAATHGGGEVRIAAQKLADGRVEVALQQLSEDGSWGERQLPSSRFLPADAPTGRWLTSSSLETAAVAAVAAAPELPEVCVVHHGSPSDEFWRSLGSNALFTGANVGLWVWVHGEHGDDSDHGGPEHQAETIRACVDDGVAAIATTAPDADALREAIRYAQDAGVFVLTFNSGSSEAESLGVPVHVALDERAVGRHAGNAFNEAGAEGIALCILHERNNSGLEERCDALEATYTGGEMERLYVTGVEDLAASRAEITERLEAGGVGALMTLNTALMLPSAQAVQAAGSEAKIGATGELAAMAAVASGQVLFAISDQPWFQIDYALASVDYYVSAIARGLPLESIALSPTTIVLVQPFVIDRPLAQETLAALDAFLAEQFPEGVPGQ